MSGVAAILRQEGYLAGAMSCVVLTGPGGEDNKHGAPRAAFLCCASEICAKTPRDENWGGARGRRRLRRQNTRPLLQDNKPALRLPSPGACRKPSASDPGARDCDVPRPPPCRVASRSTRKPFVDVVLDPTQLLPCTFKHINMSLSEKTEEEERVLKDISSKILASMERASRVYYL